MMIFKIMDRHCAQRPYDTKGCNEKKHYILLHLSRGNMNVVFCRFELMHIPSAGSREIYHNITKQTEQKREKGYTIKIVYSVFFLSVSSSHNEYACAFHFKQIFSTAVWATHCFRSLVLAVILKSSSSRSTNKKEMFQSR